EDVPGERLPHPLHAGGQCQPAVLGDVRARRLYAPDDRRGAAGAGIHATRFGSAATARGGAFAEPRLRSARAGASAGACETAGIGAAARLTRARLTGSRTPRKRSPPTTGRLAQRESVPF